MPQNQNVPMEEFYAAVGKAMTSWFSIEEALADLFSRLTTISVAGTAIARPDGLWVVAGIFHAITNIPARLTMIDDIAGRLITDDEILSEWKSVKKAIVNCYKDRNVLAHGAVWGNAAGASAISGSIFARKRKSLTYLQVLDCDGAFRKLGSRVSALAVAVNRHLVPS